MLATPAARSLPASAEVLTLQSYEIDEHWFWIERFLKRVEGAPWTLQHVKQDLKSASAQLWGLVNERSSVKGIVITRLENYHDTRFGLVWIAAGEGVEHSRVMLDEIERWFKSMGCTRVEITGRKGWERVLPGYECKHVVLSKELR